MKPDPQSRTGRVGEERGRRGRREIPEEMPSRFLSAAANAPAPSPASDGELFFLALAFASRSMVAEPQRSALSDSDLARCAVVLPTSETSIDQGIAYVLMLVALVLTYLNPPLVASSPYKLF
ncbi:hypothetical protein ZIOFF_074847 [Zingiber officinale]|uniref:Uncharacterized protein n=1 Tax=Zingiber officinale TaxID=94328 RepID=A0A8J5BTZ8_ZINOF|nr:hypothetical protein ZIOFF_074847 [Zingiber officinale]